jgi:hypothetical protein
LYIAISQHRKRLTVNRRDESGDLFRKRQVSTGWLEYPREADGEDQIPTHQAVDDFPHSANRAKEGGPGFDMRRASKLIKEIRGDPEMTPTGGDLLTETYAGDHREFIECVSQAEGLLVEWERRIEEPDGENHVAV